MAKVLLIGRGPLPEPGQHHTGFAQLRTQHFLQALERAGHAVETLLIQTDHAPELLARARSMAREADVVVSAGPHRPALVAVAAVSPGQPLWVDLPGDPLAELQALVQAPGETPAPERIAEAHAMTRAALNRADHLSVISQPQHYAAIGQLSLLGRIDHTPPPVSVIPIAYHFPFSARPPRPIPTTGPVRVALCGAFAPWFDDQTLADGLQRALHACPRLHVCVTGGGVEGHYTAGYDRFRQWARASDAADRIQLHGWIPHEKVPEIIGNAHIGVCIDRAGSEPMLGSRTRVLLFAWLGLHVLASPTTELVADLHAQDLCTSISPATTGEQLAERLLALVRTPPTTNRVVAASRHLTRRYAPSVINAPLLRFVEDPVSLSPTVDPVALVTAELEAAREALGAVHASPTWRLLSRLHRPFRSDS